MLVKTYNPNNNIKIELHWFENSVLMPAWLVILVDSTGRIEKYSQGFINKVNALQYARLLAENVA